MPDITCASVFRLCYEIKRLKLGNFRILRILEQKGTEINFSASNIAFEWHTEEVVRLDIVQKLRRRCSFNGINICMLA